MADRRILLLITDLKVGGTPTVVRELALRLRQAADGADIQVTCLDKLGPVGDQLQNRGVTVTALNAADPRDWSVLPRFVHLLRDRRFDTVFSFLLHANALAAAASLWVRDVRWIQSIQTTQPLPRWHWWLQRLIHRAADAIVVPSPSVAAVAMHWSHIPAEKIVVIPNAVDPDAFEPSAVPATDPRPYPIVFLGRLDPIKDVPTLIDSVSLLGEMVHLHIYGDGSDRTAIEQRIADRGNAAQITLHGVCDNPQAALAHAGLLVLPSLAEGFGLVLIEAMAAGVPIVAADAPGIVDVVRNGQTALLTARSNPEQMSAAIRRLVQDRSLREQLIANAAVEVRRRFAWNGVLQQYLHLLGL